MDTETLLPETLSATLPTSSDEEHMSHAQIYDLIYRIEGMAADHHLQIFQIIRNDSVRFSHNQNGVFVNMANASRSTLYKIASFVRETEEREHRIKSSQATLANDVLAQTSMEQSLGQHALPSGVVLGHEAPVSAHAAACAQGSATASQAVASLNALEKKAIGGAAAKISRRRNLQLNSKVLRDGSAPAKRRAAATKDADD
jgi:hypothetical protein